MKPIIIADHSPNCHRAGQPSGPAPRLKSKIHRIARAAGAVFLAAAVSGCGAHFYDAGRDKVASSLLKGQSALDATKSFETAAANLDTLLKGEISVRDEHVEILRDQYLWASIKKSQSVRKLVEVNFDAGASNYVRTRLSALGVESTETMGALKGLHATADSALKVLTGQDYQDKKKKCADKTDLSKDCQDFRNFGSTSTDNINDLCEVGGQIGAACGGWRSTRAQIDLVTADREKLAQELSVQGGGQKKKAADGDDLSDLQAKAESVADIVSRAANIGDALGVNAGLTEARVSALETLLRSFATGEADQSLESDSLKRASVIAAGIPGLGEDLVKLATLQGQSGPRTAVLLELSKQRLRLAFLDERIKLLKVEEQRRFDLLKSLLHEVSLINSGDVFAKQAGPVAKRSIARVIASEPRSKGRVKAMRALVSYDQTFSVAQRDQDRARYEILDSKHRQALLADNYAAQIWASLIKAPIEQLAAYHSGGVRPEAVASLITNIAAVIQLGRID